MTTNVIEIKGKRFVLVEEAEYRRMKRTPRPELPPADTKGRRPARETMRAIMARNVIEDRERLGLTQKELAGMAGIRQETICRLEAGKHSPNVETMEKIDRALKSVERRQHRRSA